MVKLNLFVVRFNLVYKKYPIFGKNGYGISGLYSKILLNHLKNLKMSF